MVHCLREMETRDGDKKEKGHQGRRYIKGVCTRRCKVLGVDMGLVALMVLNVFGSYSTDGCLLWSP